MTPPDDYSLVALTLPAGTRVVVQPGNLVYEVGTGGRLEIYLPKAVPFGEGALPVEKQDDLCANG
jgi:hypothetical protein